MVVALSHLIRALSIVVWLPPQHRVCTTCVFVRQHGVVQRVVEAGVGHAGTHKRGVPDGVKLLMLALEAPRRVRIEAFVPQ